jgi:ubiquinone/menaquinone biosynthesis C-methylase UbiE
MWRALARQLSNPQGLAGWTVGKLMTIANRQPTRIAIDALRLMLGDDVLDLGCGPGQAMAAMLPLVSPKGSVCGLDQSQTMVRQALRANSAGVRSGQVSVKQGIFEKLSFPANSFDKILASNVMYFWHDVPVVVRELRRVLRSGGLISIYLTSAETMRNWKIADSQTHRLFDVHDVNKALIEGGFSVEEVQVSEIKLTGNVVGLLAVIHDKRLG